MKNAVDINRIKCYNTNRKPLRLRRKDVKDMKKLDELITMIGNMFTDTYVAGDRKDPDSFRTAKAQREHLYDEIRELYAELEHESYEREQFENELQKAQHELEERRRTHAKLNMNEIYGKNISHVDDRSLYPSANDNREEWLRKNTTVFDNIPDDADKFSEQDLPFPDVDNPAPASEVEGSEE